MDRFHPLVETELHQCRICLVEQSDQTDLIAPCFCKGSQQFVHRNCLDDWRATQPNGRAFTHCSVCDFEYVIEETAESAQERRRQEQRRLLRFRAFVARDTFAVFLLIQAVIVLLGLVVRACDAQGRIRALFPDWLSDHEKTSYYICGLVLFLTLLGLLGLCSLCFDEQAHANHCGGGCYFIDCRGFSGGSQGSDDGKACLIILLVLVIVLAFVGVFVGLFLGTLLIQRIMQRHNRILWLREETKKFRVKDFYGQPLPAAPTTSMGLSPSQTAEREAAPLLHPRHADGAPNAPLDLVVNLQHDDDLEARVADKNRALSAISVPMSLVPNQMPSAPCLSPPRDVRTYPEGLF